MNRTTRLAAAVAVMTSPAVAQQSDLREAAENFVENEAMQTTLDEVLSTDAFVEQFRANDVQLSHEQIRTISEIINDELTEARPAFEEALALAAAATFTLSELEAMNAFYESEAGRASAAKAEPFMASFYARIEPTLRKVQADILDRVADEFDLSSGGGEREG